MTFSPPRNEKAKMTAPPRFERNKSLPKEEDLYDPPARMDRNNSVPSMRPNAFDEIPIKGVKKDFNELLEEKMKDETTDEY